LIYIKIILAPTQLVCKWGPLKKIAWLKRASVKMVAYLRVACSKLPNVFS